MYECGEGDGEIEQKKNEEEQEDDDHVGRINVWLLFLVNASLNTRTVRRRCYSDTQSKSTSVINFYHFNLYTRLFFSSVV